MATFAGRSPTGTALRVAETQCGGRVRVVVNHVIYGRERALRHGDNKLQLNHAIRLQFFKESKNKEG